MNLVITVCWSSASTAPQWGGQGRKTHWFNEEQTGPRCGVLEHLLYDSGDAREVTEADVWMHVDCERCLKLLAKEFARLKAGCTYCCGDPQKSRAHENSEWAKLHRKLTHEYQPCGAPLPCAKHNTR